MIDTYQIISIWGPRLLGRDKSFDAWLSLEDRRNFITKSIAGSDDLEQAKWYLSEKFSLIGLVEFIEYFMDDFRNFIWLYYRKKFQIYSVRINSNSDRNIINKRAEILMKYKCEIKDANFNDIQLYQFVLNQIIPNQKGRLTKWEANNESDNPHNKENALFRIGDIKGHSYISYLYRNLIYKPYVGRLPFSPHRLPIYTAKVNQ